MDGATNYNIYYPLSSAAVYVVIVICTCCGRAFKRLWDLLCKIDSQWPFQGGTDHSVEAVVGVMAVSGGGWCSI